MFNLLRAMTVAGIALAALPASLSLSSAGGEIRLAQSADQPQVTAPPEAAQQAVPKNAPEDGTPATVIDDREVEGILGKSVRSATGEDMGKIIDVIVKRDGQVRAAVIDFGGFLGVGSRKIAVDWRALSFPATGVIDHIILNLTRDQVRLAPEYRSGEPVVVVGASEATQSNPDQPAQADHPAQSEKPVPEH